MLDGERAQTPLSGHATVWPFEKYVAFRRALAYLVEAVDATMPREDVVQLNRIHRTLAQNPDRARPSLFRREGGVPASILAPLCGRYTKVFLRGQARQPYNTGSLQKTTK
jgi:hypothetical protein